MVEIQESKERDAKAKESGDGASRQDRPLFLRVVTLLLGLVALVGVLLAVPSIRQPLFGLLGAVSRGDGPEIRSIVHSYGTLAPAVSVALILLHAVVPLPAEMLALADGLAFGFWGGLAVTWGGFMLAAILTYAAGRLWGRPLLERAVSERHRERLDGWLEREGAFPLLAVRLVPLVPFNAACLAAGVVRAPLPTYAWTTGLGILPLGIALNLLGSRLGGGELRLDYFFWTLSAILLIAVLSAWWISRRRAYVLVAQRRSSVKSGDPAEDGRPARRDNSPVGTSRAATDERREA